MQSIQTKILPATNTKPYRVKAWCGGGELILSIHEIPASYDVTMHEYTAEKLACKLGWLSNAYSDLVSGCLPNGDYCHVLVQE